MILIDTHIWIRWLLPNDPLPLSLIDLIETTDSLAVSSISCWEIVMLERFNRIELPLPVDEWLQEALNGSEVNALSINENIAMLAGQLPYHHKDPADRLIIATAIINKIKLISLDSSFKLYQELNDYLIL
ncbi:twitching motility protein PilT [Candidatus Magnetomorum sp. HK-1]|nr:twitching motility protein PilT [Candidatus Magnetomorum sp. HK-1]